MTEYEVAREILATVQRIEALLIAAAAPPSPETEMGRANEEQWRCGCWPKPMGAPPGVLCEGCGMKARWRP